MPEETYNIYDLLDAMRERPAMYTGYVSLICLQAFVGGYGWALHKRGVKDISQPLFGQIEFHNWVAGRLGYDYSTPGWCNLILADTLGWSPKRTRWEKLLQSVKPADDAAALDRFYELLDEYRREGPV